MSVEVLYDREQGEACFATPERAFGPVLKADEDRGLDACENALAFLEFLSTAPLDPQLCEADELERRYMEFLARPEALFIDGKGIAFAEAEAALRREYGRAANFPEANRTHSPTAQRKYKAVWHYCQICGRDLDASGVRKELHHIAAGTKGRSDEPTAMLVCCDSFDGCHAKITGGEIEPGEVQYHKWRTDRENTDWERLAILHGQFLPELIVPKEGEPRNE